ncbi:MAG: PAS domain-containing protein [Planctomycetes bacterium]|nr:PAS domain-containing protein [Planctomycetota bacterium]
MDNPEHYLDKQLEALFQHSFVGVTKVELATGKLVRVNKRYAEIVGYTVEELTGRDIREFTVPGDIGLTSNSLREMGRGTETEANIKKRYFRKDGSIVWVSITSVPLWKEDGVPKYNLALVSDITENKRIESALAEQLRMTEVLMSHLPGMVYRCANDRDWTLEFTSQGAFALTGYPAEDFVSRKVSYGEDVIVPEDRELVWNEIQRGLSENGRFQLNYRIRTKSDEIKHVWEQGSGVYDENENLIALEGFITDTTRLHIAEERRLELERQVQHSQKLESLGILAGGIAHDFNNLLVAILGNADLALMDLPPSSPATESVREIVKASRRASELTRQMLAYSGKGKFVVTSLDLRTLVQEMTHLLRVSISKKASIEFSFAEELPLIEGDATQLRQVVMNLITNAAEAIGDADGTIVLTVDSLHCDRAYLSNCEHSLQVGADDELPEGIYVFIEVSDSGCGMEDEVRSRVFDPFFSTKFAGRGLGMSAVSGIVRGHRGAIRIVSAPGSGSSFRVLFPESANQNATIEHEILEAPPDDWKCSGTILIVDDEESVRRLASQMAEKLGLEVVVANNGRDALGIYVERRDSISLVLLDMTMPGMDGEETFRELRKLDPGVKVILSSGYNEQDARSKFAGPGSFAFVHKPYTYSELGAAIKTALSFSAPETE